MQSDGIADGAACCANIQRRKPVFICHDLTRETRGYLVDDLCDVVIDQNARLIAEQSVDPPARLDRLLGALSDQEIHRAAIDLQGKRADSIG